MKLPENFEYYLEKGIVRKITQTSPKAKFLIKESETSLNGLNETIKIIGINEINANSIIKNCYDILMELIRAKLFLEGYSASGNFAHKAEISYLKVLGFSEIEVSFLNELNYARNGMLYYGTIFDKEYAEKVVKFMNKIYHKLKGIVNKNG